MAERILGLDIGDRRIGVAVSNDLGLTAQPVGVITRQGWGPDVKKIQEAAQKYRIQTILCGLPKNMDGSEGGQAQKVRELAQQLEKAGFAILYQDERLTTVSAEKSLIESGMRRKERKGVVDCTAAILILQSYLDDMNRQKNQKKEEEQTMSGQNNEENNLVELIGEDGTPVQFEHLMTLEHAGKTYVLLTPAEPETPDEEGSVVIMCIGTDDQGEECYILEEDEEVLDAVFNRFLEIMEEEEEDDEE